MLEEEAHHVGRRAVQLGAELLRRGAPLDDDRALGDGSIRRRVRGHRLRRQLLHGATTAPTSPCGGPGAASRGGHRARRRDGRGRDRQGHRRDHRRGHRRDGRRSHHPGAGHRRPCRDGHRRDRSVGRRRHRAGRPTPPGRPAPAPAGRRAGATRTGGRRDGPARRRQRPARGRRDGLARRRERAGRAGGAPAPRGRAGGAPGGRPAGAAGRAPGGDETGRVPGWRRDGPAAPAGWPRGRPERPGRPARRSCSRLRWLEMTRCSWCSPSAALAPRPARRVAAGATTAGSAGAGGGGCGHRDLGRSLGGLRHQVGRRVPRPARLPRGARPRARPVRGSATGAGAVAAGRDLGVGRRLDLGRDRCGLGRRRRPSPAGRRRPSWCSCEPAWAALRAGRRASDPPARPCGAPGRPGPPRCSRSGS